MAVLIFEKTSFSIRLGMHGLAKVMSVKPRFEWFERYEE